MRARSPVEWVSEYAPPEAEASFCNGPARNALDWIATVVEYGL